MLFDGGEAGVVVETGGVAVVEDVDVGGGHDACLGCGGGAEGECLGGAVGVVGVGDVDGGGAAA